MKSKLKQFVLKWRHKIASPLLLKLGEQNEQIRLVANENMKNRALIKIQQSAPIKVLFVCHEPAIWSSFESIYEAMEHDPQFNATILTLPYKHASLPPSEYKDSKTAEFLEGRGLDVVRGYDPENDKWKAPSEFNSDYIFYQTPYEMFPLEWSARHVSLMSRVCYVPYACNIFGGEVDKIAHPPAFFENVSLIFKEGKRMRDIFVRKFQHYKWFDERKVVVSGYPKLDKLRKKALISDKKEKWSKAGTYQVLWTPRWRTGEGNCHFFEYKDFFSKFFSKHTNQNLVFRPHPLCFQNFVKTGEMSEKDLYLMEGEYEQSSNMLIDKSGSYEEVFLNSDILVSDMSSLLLEYFVTGKPIIYTHKVDSFNELGRDIAKGFYWVRNEEELEKTLAMLLSGEDRLFQIRKDLIQSTLLPAESGNAGSCVKNILLENFTAQVEYE